LPEVREKQWHKLGDGGVIQIVSAQQIGFIVGALFIPAGLLLLKVLLARF
jgi:hypothetical protein